MNINKLSKQVFLQIFVIIFALFFIVLPVSAARVTAVADSQNISLGQQFKITFYLSSEEPINAVEGSIKFSSDILQLKEVLDGNSFINLWIKKPQSASPGEIVFSGIAPGGYAGQSGQLFSAVFKAEKSGEGSVNFYDFNALLDDGKGTSAEVTASNLHFSVSDALKQPSEIVGEQEKDFESPEIFQPEIAKDETMFSGKWFIVFSATDKNSGIDYYEIKESRQKILLPYEKWITAESPYVLKDQQLKSYIFVKAVDKSGNERIVQIAPKYPLGWYEDWIFWSIIILIGVIIGIIFGIIKIWRRIIKN